MAVRRDVNRLVDVELFVLALAFDVIRLEAWEFVCGLAVGDV